MNLKILIFATLILLIDQVTKVIVSSLIVLNTSVKVISNFFYLTYHHNYGAAWGILSKMNWLLIVASLIGIIVVYRYIRTFKENTRNSIAFGLLFGGISGNMIDRVFIGYVRDFLDFRIINNFPVFNVADMAIVIGVLLLIVAILKGEDNREINRTK